MFDFERLDLYQVIKDLNKKVYAFLKDNKKMDPYLTEKWKDATFNILLSLTEGIGRINMKDKQHFISLARGSVFECVAIADFLKDAGEIKEDFYDDIYQGYEQTSKMLLGMYRSFNRPKTRDDSRIRNDNPDA
jgi:four helix bundle protein